MWSKFPLACCKTLNLFNKSLCIRCWALFANPMARVAFRCKILSLFNKTLCIGYWAEQISLGNKSTIRYLLFLLCIGKQVNDNSDISYPHSLWVNLSWGRRSAPLRKGRLGNNAKFHLGPTFEECSHICRSHILRNVHSSHLCRVSSVPHFQERSHLCRVPSVPHFQERSHLRSFP